MTDDLLAFLHQQFENQRFRGESLKTLAFAMPAPETAAYLTETGELLLREVEAKRRILDAYVDAIRMHGLMEETDDDGKWDWLFRSEALENVVRLLALPYADHPEFRPEWRP